MRSNRDVARLLATLIAVSPLGAAQAQDAPAAATQPEQTQPAQQVPAPFAVAPAPALAPVVAPVPANPSAPAPSPLPGPLDTAAQPAPAAATLESVIAVRLSGKKDEELAAFYAARGNAPIWIENGHLSDKARAAMARIARAGEDGLDAGAFILPDAANPDSSLDSLAASEIALSHAAIAYARQAQGGRIEPTSISPNITAEPTRPQGADVLRVMSTNDDTAAWLASYNPPHAGYVALRKRLAELRATEKEAEAAPPPVPQGALLKPGMSDARVPLLRARFNLPEGADTLYDPALLDAVKAFQKKAGVRPDGMLGKRSLDLLNSHATPEDEIKLVLVNMERWRWLPRDLGVTHVMVNVPEFEARIVRAGAVVHETRVVVGKPTNQTPIFSNEMQFIIVNPAWNVPASIASKEMLPNLQRDPYYLARQGMEVLDVSGKKPVVIDSTAVDWSRVNMNRLRIRQPPGERNALGHIKFMFPNKHAVYLHDTPSRGLFANAVRAYSHGCVRVQDPFALADVLLEGSAWNADKMKKLIGNTAERRINLAHKVPIHIVYFTAEIGPDGRLIKRADLYGHDRRMKTALALEGQAQASIRLR
jgi:murein L,D-transpeptidase YcbB/YkuD